MKKVLLTKTLIPIKTEAVAMVIKEEPVDLPSITLVNQDNTYQKRKSLRNEYSDLFQALFRIPDKHVQQRVLDAINGIESSEKGALCPRCKLNRKRTMKDVCTQVDLKVDLRSNHISETLDNGKTSEHNHLMPITSSGTLNAAIANDAPPSQTTENNKEVVLEAQLPPARKRRKRKICLPQVIKKSHAQQAQNHLQPKMMRHKALEEKTVTPVKKPMLSPASSVRSRTDSFGSFSFLDNVGELNEMLMSNEHDLVLIMAHECLRSEVLKDGLLPIHDTVIDNEIFALRRQIYVWKIWKKVDLEELLTDDNEDCLQLAVVNNCQSATIKILLEAGMNTTCIDAYSNTVIHLAVINELNVESLQVLMRGIDLEMLLRLNDDGYTPLHLAVRQDCYILAEVILNVLDERLQGTNRHSSSAQSKDKFLKFYEKVCKDLEGMTGNVAKHKLKNKLLDAGDLRSGNTALFFALENQMEHFVWFLLAHLTDPRIPNHSGQNARGFYSEFGRILNLNIKIERVMDTVIEQI